MPREINIGQGLNSLSRIASPISDSSHVWTQSLNGSILPLGREGVGKVQHHIGADQAERGRKRKGTGRRTSNAPLRLVFITVAAAAAFATQFVMNNGALMPSAIANWLEPLPPPMGGRA